MLGTYENIDCMELMATLKDKEIDLAIVDPPYGIGFDSEKILSTGKTKFGWNRKKSGYIKKEWDSSIPNEYYFSELFRVSKNQIIWGANHYLSFLQSGGMIFWDKCISEKFTLGDGEIAWTNKDKIISKFVYRWSGFLKGDNGNQREERIHPTQKPVKLYEWLLTNYAKPNDLILDTHCGSASSLIACENLGFKYIASELDKDYYHQSLQRLEAHLSQGKLFQRVGRDEIQISQPSMFA